MKLLQKPEIAVAKARDASREVSEGLKLTRRVDALRELRLSEEKNLEDWRRETLTTIQAQITALEMKKEGLQSQIAELEKKISYLSPKMATERLSLIELKKELSTWQKELEKKASQLLTDELEIAEAIHRSEVSERNAVGREAKALDLEASAEKKHLEAQDTLRRANKIHEKAVQDREDIERSLSLRENAVILREKKASAAEMANIKMQKENQNEQRRLVDVSEMLQRDLIRLKKLRTDGIPR